jgi:hypothetical protein
MKEFFVTLMTAQVAIATYEAILLLAILTFCLLIRSFKIGMLVAFLFAFRFGWLFFENYYGGKQISYLVFYVVFGVIVFFLSLYQMVREES